MSVETILEKAKRSKRKGIQAYESYKSDINQLRISSDEYCQACRKLAKIMRV